MKNFGSIDLRDYEKADLKIQTDLSEFKFDYDLKRE